MRPFIAGDDVTVTLPDGRRLAAVVRVASSATGNQSLVLEVPDGMIGPWVGMVPILSYVDGRAETLDSIPLELRLGPEDD